MTLADSNNITQCSEFDLGCSANDEGCTELELVRCGTGACSRRYVCNLPRKDACPISLRCKHMFCEDCVSNGYGTDSPLKFGTQADVLNPFSFRSLRSPFRALSHHWDHLLIF